jgi:acyl-coenzyme A synthetase/AMP-(fatty) acid ligase
MTKHTLKFRNRILMARKPADILLVRNNYQILVADIETYCGLQNAADIHDASVMILVTESLACALALIECDGIAKRLIICPPGLSVEHLQVLAERSSVDVIISDPDSSLPPELSSGRRILRFHEKAFKRKHEDNTETIPTEWILLTSGTTGVPKMVSHNFDSLTSNIRRPKSETEKIIWASFNDTRRFSGLQMFLQAMLTDSTLVLRTYNDSVADFLQALAKAGATHVSGTPTHWRKVLMYQGRRQFKFEQITLVGEIADQSLLNALHAEFPAARLSHIYGSTETGTGFAVHDGHAGFPRAIIGHNLNGAEFAIDGEKLKVRSIRAASKYVGTTQDLKDSDGFIDTGDAVELVGERYRFLGRRSGTINIGGSHVHPEEVEAVLNTDARVLMSRVTGRKNPFTGAILVADVMADVPSSGKEALSKALLEICRNALAGYKVPAIIRIVDDIAISDSGKLERRSA